MNITAASSIIIREEDSKVFVARRSINKKLSPGEWETIGGKIEENESPEECIEREIREELGVKILSLKFFKDYELNRNITRVFVVKLSNPPIPNEKDFMDFGWFLRDEIKNMNFALNCRDRILDYFNNSGPGSS